jgi:hypothetical protein
MKIRKWIPQSALCAALGVVCAANSVSATTVTFSLDTLFEKDRVSGTPTLSASFTDISGGVRVTLNPSGLANGRSDSDNNLHVHNDGAVAWFFNVVNDYDGNLQMKDVVSTGNGFWFDSSTDFVQSTDPLGRSGGAYDWGLKFRGSGPGGDEFGSTDTLSFTLSSTKPGLDATDFLVKANNGAYYTEARFEGCHGWLGATTGCQVPDGGATAGLLGAAVAGLAALRRGRQGVK